MKGTALSETALPAQLPSAIEGFTDERVPHDRSLRARAHHPGRPVARFLAGGAFAEHASSAASIGTSSPDELYLEPGGLGGPELNVKAGRFEQSTTMFKSNEAMIAPFPLASTRLNGLRLPGSRRRGRTEDPEPPFWASGVVRNNDETARTALLSREHAHRRHGLLATSPTSI